MNSKLSVCSVCYYNIEYGSKHLFIQIMIKLDYKLPSIYQQFQFDKSLYYLCTSKIIINSYRHFSRFTIFIIIYKILKTILLNSVIFFFFFILRKSMQYLKSENVECKILRWKFLSIIISKFNFAVLSLLKAQKRKSISRFWSTKKKKSGEFTLLNFTAVCRKCACYVITNNNHYSTSADSDYYSEFFYKSQRA